MIKLSLQNADQVAKHLNETVKDFNGKAAKSGMREVGKLLAKDLRGRVGSRSGALRRSITTKIMPRRVKGWNNIASTEAAMEVGALRKVTDSSGRKRSQFYKFRWQEYGTKAHMTRAWIGGNNRQLSTGEVRRLNGTGQVLKRSVLHPGHRGRRTLSDAMRSGSSEADQVFTKGVGKLLRKHGVQLG